MPFDDPQPRAIPTDIDSLHVVELRQLDAVHRNAAVETLVDTYRAAWGDCTDAYSSRERTRAHLRRRLTPRNGGATFVALTRHGDIAGTGSIGSDDYYDGFSKSNGVVDPGYVGRDLYTMPSFRGVAIQGLKVWMHLLEARLEWVIRRGAAQLTVFTEPGPVDLTTLYARLGAVVVRRGLAHRRLGDDAITMLAYPATDCLDRLKRMRCSTASTSDVRTVSHRRSPGPAPIIRLPDSSTKEQMRCSSMSRPMPAIPS